MRITYGHYVITTDRWRWDYEEEVTTSRLNQGLFGMVSGHKLSQYCKSDLILSHACSRERFNKVIGLLSCFHLSFNFIHTASQLSVWRCSKPWDWIKSFIGLSSSPEEEGEEEDFSGRSYNEPVFLHSFIWLQFIS